MSFDSVVKLAETLVSNSSEGFQSGGASKVSSKMSQSDAPMSKVEASVGGVFAAYSVAVLVWVVAMLVVALIVQVLYNYIMPRLVLSYGGQEKLQKFMPLKYVDALALLVLARCLF
jgi:hypothetical protein